MAYSPENNPYIPGDPYSYDLKWIVQQIKAWKDPEISAAEAKASADAAAASAAEAQAAAALVDIPFITPEKFGAVGDGITDDSDAFESCFAIPNVIIMLRGGKNYLIQRTMIIKKNTYLFGNNATITSSVKHAFFNFEQSGTDTGYDGNGNILIKDLNLVGGGISFIHGKDILIDNCHFLNCLNDHWIEICACSHYTVSNCTFKGMAASGSDYINIDPCFYTNFPWLDGPDTFDGTPNEYITVKYCTFEPGEGSFTDAYNAFGVHSAGTGTPANHDYIIFDHNTIRGFTGYGARLNCMDHVQFSNNYIEKSTNYFVELGGLSTKVVNPTIINNTLINTGASNLYFVAFRSGGFTLLTFDGNICLGPINREIYSELDPDDAGNSIAKLQRIFSGTNGTVLLPPKLFNEMDIFSGSVGNGTYHHNILRPYYGRNFSVVGEVYPVVEYNGGNISAASVTITATGFTTTLGSLAGVFIAKNQIR